MSEITNYSELENFWISLEEDFFQRMDNVLMKIGLDLNANETEIHELKKSIGERMIRYQHRLVSELEGGKLTYKRIQIVFSRLEVNLQSQVNEFIGKRLSNNDW